MELRTEHYINGEWVAGEGPPVAVEDPGQNEVLAEIPTATMAQCLTAVDAAAAAGESWSRTAPRERAEVLRRAFNLIHAEADLIARIMVAENGKLLAEARGEVVYAAEFFRWFSEEAVRIGGELRRAPAGDKQIIVLPKPVGVALLVTPWNFPAAMATRKIGPALAAGCTVVLKPSEITPFTAFALADILDRAGCPAGVVNVVLPDPPAEPVQAMLEHDALRMVSFTGSTTVGARLMELAAPRALRCSMELGGNAPFIVLDDADIDVAVEAAMAAKLRNTGASCIAANRFFVHASVAEEFSAALSARMSPLRVGPGTSDVDLGALASTAERDKVAALVSGSIDGGARVLAGGGAPSLPGAFYLPTVLDQITPDADILQQEIFGPVAPIATFEDVEDAIAWSNSTPAGLAAYVMTQDLRAALQIAERIETGMLGVNRGLISDPAAPFGGAKASGLGREGGHEGIEEYLERMYVAADW